MVNILAPVGTKTPTYVKVANFPGLYRHSRSGRYYACKKLGGVRRESSLRTCDRKIAERRLKDWIGSLDKVDAEVEKTTLGQLIQRFVVVTGGMAHNTHVTNHAIINEFLRWCPHGKDYQVRLIRPSSLDEWLALQEPRLRNVSYNRYAGFLKQLFEIAVKDRIIAESPAKSLRLPWKKPQTPKRIIPSLAEFQAIVADIRALPLTVSQTRHTEDTADFLEFLGLAGLGQAEASSLTWGDVDWSKNELHIRRHKTDTQFVVPIYDHLRPLLERLSKERRGKRSPAALVFKIKDAKKALGAACKRLKLPPFSQRSLRQQLIMRLWRAGVDKKLIARWQGHSDGGQLILDTYTQAFGSDDEEYVRGQLAKIGGGTVTGAAKIAQSGNEREANAPSNFMKKRMRKARPRASVAPAATVTTNDPVSPSLVPATVGPDSPVPATASVQLPAGNPYKKGDRVKTACKGADVEAEVTAVFKDEVQVRTPDGELRWRTVRTVQPMVVLLTPPDPMDVVEPPNSGPRIASKRSRGQKRVRQNRLS